MIHRVLVNIVVLLAVTFGTYALKLRRLHLFRPDLIPYPVDFPVYC